MANFNPSIGPTSDPNYLSYSRPISSVDADKSGAAIFKGITDIFETGVKGQDVFELERAKATVGRDVREIQGDYISELTKVAQAPPAPGAPGTPSVGAGAGVSSAGDIIPPPPVALPQGIEQDVAAIREQGDILTTARANGKISTTHFRARLYQLAQSYRNANPGYADVYDKVFEEITGVKPANALISSLIGDLNAAAAAASGQRNAVERYLLQHMKEVPEGNLWYDMFKRGLKSEQEVLDHFYKNMEWDARHKREQSGIKLRGDRDKELEANDEKRAIDITNQRVSNSFSLMDIGIAGPGASAQQVQDTVEGWIKGTIPLPSDREAGGYIAALENRYGKTRQEIRVELAKPRFDVNGKPIPSMLSVLGKKADEIIDRQLDATFGHTIRLFKDKEYGFAFQNANTTRRMMSDTTRELYDDKDMGDYARISKAISELGPGANTELLRSALTSNLTPSLPDRMKNYVIRNTQRAAVPPAPGEDKTSISEDIERVTRVLGKDGSGPTAMFSVEAATGALMNPKLPLAARRELATYLYGPRSADFLEKFKTDYVNERGRQMPGKYRLYEYMGSPAMSQAIKEMNDPAVSALYRNWMENTFGNNLLRSEIHDLTNLHLPENVKPYYDSQTKQFGFMVNGIPVPPHSMNDMQRALGARMAPEALRRPMGTLTRLNWGLRNLSSMAEGMGTPEEVDAYLVRKLMDFGYRPDLSPSENVIFPGQLGEAVYGERRRRAQEELQRRMREREQRGAPREPGFGR